MSRRINCNAAFVYQVQAKVPGDGSGGTLDSGQLVIPSPGLLTGITLRLSATPTGAALHAQVDAMAAAERATSPGLFWVKVSRAIHQARVLTLGRGVPFYAIWSNAAGFDMYTAAYIVEDRTVVT
ncbi:MAG TPA: hypothetical protein VJN95_08795 [Gemmatimonadales bacterium]|nr:hypothetical protein [Gemmatimonadales bacterium]